MRHRFPAAFAALAFCLACTHGQPRPDGGDDSWIEPGHTYRGEVDGPASGMDSLFSTEARFRFRTDLGERVTFRIRSERSGRYGRSVRLTRPDEKFGPEVAQTSEDVGDATVTVASVVPPEPGEWMLSFSNVSGERRWDYELEFLPRATPLVDVKEGATNGTLVETDAQDEHGHRTDAYRFQAGENGKRWHISVKGEGFQPYVRVREGKPDAPLERNGWAADYDDYEGTLHGDVFLEVAGDEPGPRGAYTLEIRDARAEEMSKMPVLEPGGSVEGRLGGDGPRAVSWKVRGTPGQKVVFEARSKDFHPLVWVHNNESYAERRVLGMDKGAEGTAARRILVWPDDAEWVVTVTNADDKGGGAFSLSLSPDESR